MRFASHRKPFHLPMPQNGISHAAILAWFRAKLPSQDEERDALIYHMPIRPQLPYTPERFWASTAIFSLTPTEGVYEYLNGDRASKKVVFLHRPWGLDRRRVPHGTLVLQSHQRFDEMYTTGYNVNFALKHNVDLDTITCIQGYKGDPERRIGLLGKLRVETPLQDYLATVDGDFQGAEAVAVNEELTDTVQAIASLNAFDLDTIQRVQAGLPGIPCDKILCITGAAREAGLVAAKECGMQVVCIGHRRTEMWGIRHLADTITQDLNIGPVHIVDEPDFVIPRQPKVSKVNVPKLAEDGQVLQDVTNDSSSSRS